MHTVLTAVLQAVLKAILKEATVKLRAEIQLLGLQAVVKAILKAAADKIRAEIQLIELKAVQVILCFRVKMPYIRANIESTIENDQSFFSNTLYEHCEHCFIGGCLGAGFHCNTYFLTF